MPSSHLFVSRAAPVHSADNAKLALGRKANLGLVDSVEPSLLRSRLPYLPYAAYDPTAGELSCESYFILLKLVSTAAGEGAMLRER